MNERITIIGAGGVTSHLLNPLLMTFRPQLVHLVDKDKLEERNLDRQLFSARDLDKPKALALAVRVPQAVLGDSKISYQVDWFSDATHIPETDLIICCADNHRARRDVLQYADENSIPAIISGNEYFDSEAYYYLPEWKNTNCDPRVRYPTIRTSNEGSPFRCTGAAQEAFPQLAAANFQAAAKILHLLWFWHRHFPSLDQNDPLLDLIKDKAPIELTSSLTDTISLSVHDCRTQSN